MEKKNNGVFRLLVYNMRNFTPPAIGLPGMDAVSPKDADKYPSQNAGFRHIVDKM